MWSAHAGVGDGDDFGDVFSIDIADDLIRHAARRPTVRVVRNGSNLDPARYTSMLRLGGQWVDVVDPDKLTALFAGGASVVYQSLHRTCPTVRTFVRDLATDISHPLQANAYLTPAHSTALAPHTDSHDVLVVQLVGTKHWHVDGLGSFDLGAGDRMYIPAGTLHSAESGERASLHLTIGIIRTTYRSVVKRLMADIGELDQPLPLDYRLDASRIDLADGVSNAIATTIAALAARCPETVVEGERVRQGPTPEGRTLRDMIALHELDADSRIAWVPGHRIEPPSVDDTDTRLRISDGSRVVRIPIGAGPALRVLTDGGDVRVGDLAELDATSQLVVARRLVEEGICVIAQAPPTVPRGSADLDDHLAAGPARIAAFEG